ncbi:MAG TPA: glycoside hydrolase N-terminal domain-containing protein, partial [Planctomycetota bacterium]|nr:glycoside hydrolase N-terminal domain-containing protein [Planctomycetota bacterium]
MISVHLRALVLLLGLVAFASAQTPPSNTPSLNLQAPEPRPLIIKGPIQRSEDGLPLGNGWLGVLVWGEGSTLRLSLDRPDLWDQRQPETLGRSDWTYATMRRLKEEGKHQEHVKLFDQPYDTIAYPTKLPGGRVEVDLGDDVEIVGFVLDFRTGRAAVQVRGA